MTPNQRYYADNRERELERARRYYVENDGAAKARVRRAANPEAQREANRRYYARNADAMKARSAETKRARRAEYTALENERRAAQANATPPWLNAGHRAEIEGIYHFARVMRDITGEQYHVDHEIPLRGRGVVGLHVPWNLRAIPARENWRKYNHMERAA